MGNAGDQIFLVRKGYWLKIFEQIVELLPLLILKSSHQRPFVKKVLLNISQILQENTRVGVSLKLQARRPATFLKRDSNTGVFPVKFPKLFRKKYL